MHYAELKTAWAELTGPGAAFEIVEMPVRGQSLRTYKNAPPNIRALWLSTAAHGDRDYLVYGDERITFAEAHARVAAVAAWLAAQGVGRGDRVAIAMRNYPEWMLIYWACVCLGVAAVGMNAWWVPEEMEFGLKDAAPKVLFADAERLARIAERPSMAVGIMLVAVRAPAPTGGIAWEDVIETRGALPEADIHPDDDASIFYTSGTTGFPKGAQLTHRGCVSNLFSIMFSGQATALATSRATGVPIDPNAPVPVPVGLITTPLFHVTANNCGAYALTAAGGKMILMYRWDAKEALTLIERERVTSMSGVPMMARELIGHPDFESHDLSSLVTLGGGGAQLPPDLVAKIDASVATARQNTGYGMTETCGIITAVSADFYIDKPESAGPAMPCFEAKCVDDEGPRRPGRRRGRALGQGAPRSSRVISTAPTPPRRASPTAAAYRRYRANRRRRLHLHRRPQERHGPARRRERLLRRGRGQPVPPSRRRRVQCLRCPGRAAGRRGGRRHLCQARRDHRCRGPARALRDDHGAS